MNIPLNFVYVLSQAINQEEPTGDEGLGGINSWGDCEEQTDMFPVHAGSGRGNSRTLPYLHSSTR